MAYRVLSLDGGGTWALIEIKALMNLYGPATTGHQVLKDFDLVVANSGGSIVAAALGCNLPLQQILALIKDPDWRAKIFVPLPWYEKLNPLRLFLPMPNYDATAKLQGLRAAFGPLGDMPLTQLPALWGGRPHLLITSFDYDRERAVFLRSNPNSPARSGAPPIEATLAEAVHASSNAPIKYFDQPAAFARHRFWDGAMAGLNNPMMVAVTEALACAGHDQLPGIQVRSLGTGSVFRPVNGAEPPLAQPRAGQSYFKDVAKTAGCILDDPPDESTFIAYATLDGRFDPARFPISSNKVVRLNPLIQPVPAAGGGWQLPGAPNPPISLDDFDRLAGLELDPDQSGVELIEKFCDAWLADIFPNQPIRANAQTLACEIGHARFSVGKNEW